METLFKVTIKLAVITAIAALTSTIALSCAAGDKELALENAANDARKKPMKYKQLSAEEEAVIIHKSTQRPFTGRFVNHHEDGTYTCKQCGEPLFKSQNKFESGSGWPAFDEAIEGAVEQIPDEDGTRTEVVCAKCGAHLGHVFKGEGFTKTQTRHCVNSISLDFQAKNEANNPTKAIFAGGCFWGVEYYLSKEPGVINVSSGYIGGNVENPTYKQVSSGTSGHAEAVEVTFDPSLTNYETLARLFFEIHDPTQINGQGPDIGSQYRSAVFYLNDEQKQTAKRLIELLKKKGLDVATKIEPAGTFWPAEQYHQDYYDNKGGQPYCHAKVTRF